MSNTTKTRFIISNVYLQNFIVGSIIYTFPGQTKYFRILKDYTVGFAWSNKQKITYTILYDIADGYILRLGHI